MSGGPGNVPKRVYFGVLTQMIIMVLGIVLTIQMSQVGKISDQNTNTVTQITDDWMTTPFTKIVVTDDKCSSGADSVFTRRWGGTEQGCLVNKLDWMGYGSSQVVMTNSEYDSYISSKSSSKNGQSNSYDNRRREPCMPISMEQSKIQDEFYDMRFCGTRGGLPFANAVRPKPTGQIGKDAYECPKDFIPCSSDTNIEYTVCISKSKTKAKECPITFMKFIDKADEAKYSGSDYTVQEVDEDHSFVYSKTKGNSLPFTSVSLEMKPCLDPIEVSVGPTTQFYPLERDRRTNDCDVVSQYGEAYDARYQDLGLAISEYDVQKESKVLKKLQDLPNYSQYVSDSSKRNNNYKFWARPTISWALKCDDKHPRNSVVAAAEFEKEKDALNESAVVIMSCIAFSVGLVASIVVMVIFCAGKCRRAACGDVFTKGCSAFGLGIQFILFTVTFFLVLGQKGELQERKTAMQNLEFVNDCGDKYTNIPENFVPDIVKANSMAIFCIIIAGGQAFMSLFLCITCVAGSQKEEEDDEIDYQKLEQNGDDYQV